MGSELKQKIEKLLNEVPTATYVEIVETIKTHKKEMLEKQDIETVFKTLIEISDEYATESQYNEDDGLQLKWNKKSPKKQNSDENHDDVEPLSPKDIELAKTTNKTKVPPTPAPTSKNLKKLIEDEYLSATELYALDRTLYGYKPAQLTRDGKIKINNKFYESATEAADAYCKYNNVKKPIITSGWEFWGIKQGIYLTPLHKFRDAYIENLTLVKSKLDEEEKQFAININEFIEYAPYYKEWEKEEQGTIHQLYIKRFSSPPSFTIERFRHDRWFYQTEIEVSCQTCLSNSLHIFRKHYLMKRFKIIAHYWAVACIKCKTVKALDELDSSHAKEIKKKSNLIVEPAKICKDCE